MLIFPSKIIRIPLLRYFRYCLIICLYFSNLYAQIAVPPLPPDHPAGTPYLRNFSPEEYGAHGQNWAACQDLRGVLYVANNLGVLEYDGVSWRLIKTANERIVSSLARDSSGRIYLGASGEFGFLMPDSQGLMHYHSLMDRVPKEYRKFGFVWQTLSTTHGIYFRTAEYLFRWADDSITVWLPQKAFHVAFAVRDTLYVRQKEVGLMRLENDTLILVPGGERFARDPVYALLPFDNHRILIGARRQGLLLFDGKNYTPFRSPANQFLAQNRLYHGAILPTTPVHFAFATLRSGVVVIDREGNIRQIINRQTGLRDDMVNFVYPDNQGGLILALDNGIARVETPSPFSRFTTTAGIKSGVVSVVRHRGRLYIATGLGVYYLDAATGEPGAPAAFRRVEKIDMQSWSLLSTGEHLLAATNSGVYVIRDAGANQISRHPAYKLYNSRYYHGRVYVGLDGGLAVLQRAEAKWQYAFVLKDPTVVIRTFAEEDETTLWAGTHTGAPLRISFPLSAPHTLSEPAALTVQQFGEEHGLPGRLSTLVYRVRDQVLFATGQGVWRFDAGRQVFEPDSIFGRTFTDTTRWILRLIEDHAGRVWIASGKGSSVEVSLAIPRRDGSYRIQHSPFSRMTDIGNGVWSIYPEKNGVVWFGGDDMLIRYDPALQKNIPAKFPALIRRAATIPGDSLIYGGASPLKGGPRGVSFPYTSNALRFEFAAPSFDESSANQYRYMLEGFDKNWSNWSRETRKDYTNLPEGDYIFRVQAKNVYQQPSSEDRFSFTILPPWYRSYWAYTLYLLFAGVVVMLIVKLRVHQLKKRTAALESLVAQRSAEVLDQKNRLEQQAKKLRELDHLKSRFFANISHEFRTPLTLILGPLEQWLNEQRFEEKIENQVRVMRQNARRLLRLINQLLDLSRLESGKMQVIARRGEIISFLKRVVMSFESLAERKQISLTFHAEPERLEMWFDRDKVDKIITNLLSNAFKFTGEGGFVEVAVTVSSSSHSSLPLPTATAVPTIEFVEFTVKDSGTGIPPEVLPYIFDRFYRAGESSTLEQEGVGIGLALCKELAEVHHGSIEVNSEPGRGTQFTLRLPLGKEAFSKDELAEETGVKSETPEAVLAAEQLTEEIAVPQEEIAPVEEKETIILLVEDNRHVRDYIREYLQTTYRVIEADDGVEGFEKAIDLIPDLVISDIMMPRMDGIQLCEKLKSDEKTSHIPMILLTARASDESKLAGLETGADDYLIKPFDMRELRLRIKNLIEQRRRLRERFSREVMLQPAEIAVTPMDEVFLQRAMEKIEAHIEDPDFGVQSFARELAMSESQLRRKLRALTGQSPNRFIRYIRLQRAAHFLRQKAGTISEIAFAVGFNNLSYFARSFQEQFGELPSEYQKKNR